MPVRLKSIEPRLIRIPFTVVFSHSSASRKETASLYVEAQSDSGLAGYGESCPREYVTGEFLSGAVRFVRMQRKSLLKAVTDLASLRDWLACHKTEVDANPAAWCAVELALIDLMSRADGISAEKFLGLPALSREFFYSAVLGDAAGEPFKVQLSSYLEAGFSRFKIKLSGDMERDLNKIKCLRDCLGSEAKVRADANNHWRHVADAIRFFRSLDYGFEAIEEPLVANDYPAMRHFINELAMPVILDESFIRVEQFGRFLDQAGQWIINLRVSKMGGLLRSINIMRVAARYGVRVVVGAQVGETSLLTRAALTIAGSFPDLLYAQEGAFGTRLLTHDIFEPVLSFSTGGVLIEERHALVDKPGFGLMKSAHADEFLCEPQ